MKYMYIIFQWTIWTAATIPCCRTCAWCWRSAPRTLAVWSSSCSWTQWGSSGLYSRTTLQRCRPTLAWRFVLAWKMPRSPISMCWIIIIIQNVCGSSEMQYTPYFNMITKSICGHQNINKFITCSCNYRR